MTSTKYGLGLVTGVFDLLHIEHIRFLAAAKNLVDQLVVGVETDERVRYLKGPNRPINPQAIRLEQVQALRSVDRALLLPAQFAQFSDFKQFMATIKPDIYAISTHTHHQDVKQEICDQLGIKLIVVKTQNPDYSSTKILDKLTLLE